jgi:hypothetical protein
MLRLREVFSEACRHLLSTALEPPVGLRTFPDRSAHSVDPGWSRPNDEPFHDRRATFGKQRMALTQVAIREFVVVAGLGLLDVSDALNELDVVRVAEQILDAGRDFDVDEVVALDEQIVGSKSLG